MPGRIFRNTQTRYEDGNIIFVVRPNAMSVRCPVCDGTNVNCRGVKTRQFRALPIGWKSVFFEADVQRVECLDCDIVRQSPLGFADPRVTYTRQMGRYALDLLRSMTIQDVAHHLGLSWDTVKDLQKRDLEA
ncbi:MAG: helix-turn-helix domain-containing protein, partial [Candidatus Ozemobacteraceae bacterium]